MLADLKKDIESVIRLRLARQLVLKRLNELLQNSTLTEEDCLELGANANERMLERWKELGWV